MRRVASLVVLAMLLTMASVRFAAAGSGAVLPLVASKLSIKLNFAKTAKDSIALTASLPTLDPAFVPTGQSISVSVGGAVRTFTLDAKGKSKVGYDQVQLKLVQKGGVTQGQVTLKIAQASLAGDLSSSGLTDANVTNESRTITLRVDLAGGVYGAAQEVTYTAKQGKTGSAKLTK